MHKHEYGLFESMDQMTRKLIEKYSPMWTNKQIWEYEQIHNVRFDLMYAKLGNRDETSWKSKLAHTDSDIRKTIASTFNYLANGYELWITNSKNNHRNLEKSLIPYIMALIVDMMIDKEICLKFREDNDCLVALIDSKADIIDCKEFFEAFYHLAIGFNYNIDTGIPDDETEAEIYLTRLQEEFDEKMMIKLGDRYIPGNKAPDSIDSK